MDALPPVAIILITYKRTDYAIRTIESVQQNLKYDGEVTWYVADDGSPRKHYDEVMSAIKTNGGSVIGSHQTENTGYGNSANQAWKYLSNYKFVDNTLWLEDDWVMNREFNITPYSELLHHHNREIGMVRLTYIPLENLVTTIYREERYYFKLMKQNLYTYSGNPHMKHTNFMHSYGMMPEDRNPGRTEITYDHIVRETEGLDIVFPPEIYKPPFTHIGDEKSYEGDA